MHRAHRFRCTRATGHQSGAGDVASPAKSQQRQDHGSVSASAFFRVEKNLGAAFLPGLD